MKNRIGYACMNEDVIPNSFRTCRKSSLTVPLVEELIAHNLHVLETIIDYNIAKGCRMFRISSDIIPFGSHPEQLVPWQEKFIPEFTKIREKITLHDIRISMHPGQYTVLNSPREEVIAAAKLDLLYHADLLDLLAPHPNTKMIIHIGGVYGDKPKAMQKFIESYATLPERIKDYLIIENDDRSYSVAEVLEIAHATGAPMVFDNLHHAVCPSLPDKSELEIISEVIKTWEKRGGKPKMHYSQQAPDKRAGSHTRTINAQQFSTDFHAYISAVAIDVMLEVKDKNRSFAKIDATIYPTRLKFEQEWARYKYLVMSRSVQDYNYLRTLFKQSNVEPINGAHFYQVIDDALLRSDDVKAQTNALQHCWGYFKKVATEKEKVLFMRKIDQLHDGKVKEQHLKNYLCKLAQKYNVKYLLDAYYLK